MIKGQSSIDLLLAIMVAIAFFSVLSIHNQNIERDVQEASVNDGLRAILTDVYSATVFAKAYDLNILYAAPKLNTSMRADCNINFRDNSGDNGDLNVISGNVGAVYRGIKLDDVKLNGILLTADPYNGTATFTCGKKFTIEKG